MRDALAFPALSAFLAARGAADRFCACGLAALFFPAALRAFFAAGALAAFFTAAALPFTVFFAFAAFAAGLRAVLDAALRAGFAATFFAGRALAALAEAFAVFPLRRVAPCFDFAMSLALEVVEMRPRVIA
ncbi:MAG TPA: hypothetical protein VFX04_06170 [Rhodanobacteraceae bacterium]|nr:hypothetical protein [Rhodanobacteraceae bacterium]